jgi:hypothetical protein
MVIFFSLPCEPEILTDSAKLKIVKEKLLPDAVADSLWLYV